MGKILNIGFDYNDNEDEDVKTTWECDVQNLSELVASKFLLLGKRTEFEILNFMSTIGGRMGLLEDPQQFIEVSNIIKAYAAILKIFKIGEFNYDQKLPKMVHLSYD